MIVKVSMKFLKLEFKLDNIIKSKATKYIVKKYYLIMSILVWFYFIQKQWKPIFSLGKKNQTKILIVRRAKQNRLILVLNGAICGKKI